MHVLLMYNGANSVCAIQEIAVGTASETVDGSVQ